MSNVVSEVTTPVGWACIIGAVAAIGVGYALSWTEFAVIGAALLTLVLLSLLFLIGRPDLDVGLAVSAARTAVGTPVSASVRVSGRRRVPWRMQVEVQLGDEVVPLLVRRADGADEENAFEVPAARRGVIQVGPVRTVRGDPIGLFRRTVEWTTTAEVHVHAETIAVPSTSTGFVRDLEGSPTRDLTANDIAFHALRDYRAGDDRRHIHWKSTARTGQLTVRQFEETRRSHIVVAFGLASADYVDGEEFELALSAAASIALRAIRDGRDVTFVTSPDPVPRGEDPASRPRVVPTLSRNRLMDELSEVDLGGSDVQLGSLVSLASNTVAGVSLVFLVCGTAPSVRELRSWSLRFPPGVETVAIVCGPAQLPSLRRVSELSVVSIGYLDDLRKALAKGAAS